MRKGRAVKRSIQRWRWIARVGDHKRPRGIVDRWSERSLFAATEWEIRAARAGVTRLTDHRRVEEAIDRGCRQTLKIRGKRTR